MLQKIKTYLPLAIQIVGGLILGISQYFKMLETLQGVSLVMFLSFEVYLVINLLLAMRAHQELRNSETRQLIGIYLFWIAMITLDLSAIWRHGGYRWDLNDSITLIIAALGVVGTLVGARIYNLPLGDPIVKGIVSWFFKAIPQVALGIKIYAEGGNGTPLPAIIAGHATIITRLVLMYRSKRKLGWNRAVRGMALSEIANEASWVIVTIMWIIRQFSH
ncbi:MAG: hypothetical protein Q8P82_02155 [bacterium]|nr:hypothetical protein [bacterium]